SSPVPARRIARIRPQPFAFEAGQRRALGALPSPLWGGVGGGGPSASYRTTPTPALRADPPHKGRVWTEFAACLIASHRNALTRGRARRAACHEVSRMAFCKLVERKASRIATARIMENSRAHAS